ncbi:DUF3159 domain-containing protein [Agrococcus lahaulensis]|uniref:DUF3159 domain-containing protein n=1 Tax=Agrococcus lahaulensis TaxID=341722 RepID=UPI000554A849|nr:DUF3159 domain-containing protein [Agrococcus lahaulensis]
MPAEQAGPADEAEPADASFSEQVGAAIRGSKLGHLDPAAKPSAGALLDAMGGARGLVESLLPGVLFLVLYATTKDVLVSVLVPLVASVAFVAWRVLQKGQPVLAFAGLIGVGISAAIALITGQGEDNFLWGFTVNTVVILVIVVSMLARRPLVGIVAGALTAKPHAWRTERAKRAVAWRATMLWLVVIGARLAVQVPMYLAGAVEALAATKLLMGVPLYLAALWVTWLMVRAVLDTPADAADGEPR